MRLTCVNSRARRDRRRAPWFLLLLCMVLTQRALGQAGDTVWVNARSQVYHCRGTEFFGRTTRGEYLLESEAIARGNRANGGRRCSAATPAPDAPVSPETRSAEGAAPVMPGNLTIACPVERIVDGDTFDCAGAGRIRPIGMDTPERTQEPHFTAATAALASLLMVGDTVRLEYDNTRTDRSNRVLAYVWLRGEMVNWLMVRRGWALALPYPTTPRYNARFDAAEQAARRERRGLWYVDGFACRPVDHRAGKC